MLNEDYPGIFQFNYSAFLSAARSVLQYICEEVSPDHNPNARAGAKEWYQKSVENNRFIIFGKDERDENVHSCPVIPDTSVTVFPKEIGASIEDVLNSTGKEAPTLFAKQKYTYMSFRWQGSENLLEVCSRYLAELEALIKDGLSKAYITW